MITLYDKSATNFEHNGIGSLEQDIIDPKIHWIDNGIFSFEFEYPLFAKHGLEITNSSIIKARDPEQDNLFFVYKIIPSMGYIKVYCYHIFYKLAFNTINDTNIVGKNGQGALTQLSGGTQYPHKFQFTSDLTNIANSRVVRKNPVEILLDSNLDNSFINRWGGHIIRHGFNISMNQSYGSNKGYKIQHKKDLMGYEATIDETTVVTRIRPVGYDGLLLPEIYIDSPLISSYPEPRIQEYSYSDVKVGNGEGEFATAVLAYAELRRLAKLEFSQNKIDVPKGIYKVDFVNLKETEEYKNFAPLKQILPGDIVAVEHEEDGINIRSQMVEYNWDPLLREYIDLTLGNYERSFTSTINKLDKIQTDIKDIHNQIELVYLSADGKNKIYSGETKPIIDQNSTEGDLWFKKNGDKTELWILRTVNGVLQWVVELSDATQEELKAAVKDAILQADKDRTKAEQDFETAKQKAKEYTDAQVIAFDTKFEAETGAIRNEVTSGYNNAIANGKAYTDNKSAEFNTQLNLVKEDVASTVLKANDAVTKADKAIADVGFLKPDVATAKANAATAVQNAVTATQNASTAIQNAQTALNSVATLTQEVDVSITNINGELTRKVSQTTFNTLSGTVGTHTTQISQTQTALSAKAESSLVNTIKGTVDTHTTQIKVVSDGLELKAESSLVNTVKGTVDSHTTQINANSTAITARLTSAQVETLLTGKQYVNQTTLNATSSGLTAQIIQVSTELSNLDVNDRNLYPNSGNFTSVLGWAGTTTIEQKDGFSTLKTLGTGYPSTSGAIQILEPDTEYIVTAEFMFDTAFTATNVTPVHIYVYNGAATSGTNAAIGLSIVGGNRTITPNVWQTVSVRFKTIDTTDPIKFKFHLFTSVTAMTKWLKYVKVQKGMKYTGWSPKVEEVATLEKVVTIEANINGIQATVANKAEQSQVTQLAGQLTSKVDSTTYSSKMTQLDSAINLRVTQTAVTEAILLDKKIKDTRSANELPSWYFANYPQQTVEEFKYRATMGVTGAEQFGQLTTKVPWSGSSGGAITQIFSSKDGVFQRTSNALGTAWLEWDQVAEAGKLVAQINLSTEGVLIQGKVIQLDGDVRMLQAFINKLDVQTLNAVNANIASIRTNMLTADVITSTHIKADNAMMDKLFTTVAVVDYLFTKTAFVNNLTVKTLSAVTANITTVRSQVLIANVVQATHLQADAATITKLFATDANVNVLTAKTAFINSVKAIDISADKITAGTLNAALMNVVGMNANAISTGTVSGANSAWNLNTGIMSFTNPTTGDIMYLDQGQIKFQNGAQGRNLKYNAEGLVIEPYSTNTGTSRNTMLRLQGGGVGSYQYIQLESGAGISQRITGLDDKILLQHSNNSGYVEITNYRGDTYEGKLLVGDITIKDANNDGLRIVNNRIESAVRSGSHNIFITPQGTGSVIVGDRGLANYWNIHASAFLTRSTRESKTNINSFSGDALSILKTITVSTFNMRQDLNKGINDLKVGFIAEDSVPIAEKDGLGRMVGINTYTATAYLVKATQELDQKVMSIANMVNVSNTTASRAFSEMQELKNKVTELELKIKKLESAA